MKRIVFLVILLVYLASLQGQSYTMTNGQTITTCSGTFYDPGGPNGNYGNNLNYTQTFVSATPGMCLRVVFSSFYLESSSFDYLRIYNGTSASGQLIGTYDGTDSPGTVTSYTGALTFVFHSDVSIGGTMAAMGNIVQSINTATQIFHKITLAISFKGTPTSKIHI